MIGGHDLDSLDYVKIKKPSRAKDNGSQSREETLEARVAIGKEPICVGALGFAIEVLLHTAANETEQTEVDAISERLQIAVSAASAVCHASLEGRLQCLQAGIHQLTVSAMERYDRNPILQLHGMSSLTSAGRLNLTLNSTWL